MVLIGELLYAWGLPLSGSVRENAASLPAEMLWVSKQTWEAGKQTSEKGHTQTWMHSNKSKCVVILLGSLGSLWCI